MNIAINLLYLIPNHVGGTQTYALSLLDSLAALDKENEYILYLNRESADLETAKSSNIRRVVCPVQAMRRERRYAYEQWILPKLLDQHQIDIVHSLGYVCPLRTSCINIVTICDLNYIALQDSMPRGKRLLLGWFVRQSARRSDHILTISEFSKKQIIQRLGTKPEKISVTHLGPRAVSGELGAAWRDVSACYKISDSYLLAFSGLSSHKNIGRLLQAYAKICTKLPQRLVLVGHIPEQGNLRAELSRLNLSSRVIITGFVPESHVMPLIRHADLFVFPSLYEGFGLPVLDAQQAGVAVACSTAASLPEVAGEGAAFYDPYSVQDMSDTLYKCLNDSTFREALIEAGYNNVRHFSWAQAAYQTLAIYRHLGSQISATRVQ